MQCLSIRFIDFFSGRKAALSAPYRQIRQQTPNWWRGSVRSTTEQQYGRPEQANKTRSSKEKGKNIYISQSSPSLFYGITGDIPTVLVVLFVLSVSSF